jgi:hypothetical protein
LCVSVCLYVCLSGYTFPHSQRIFPKFGENILWVMTRIVGYLFVSARNACACVLNARACVHWLIFERILHKFAGNVLLLTISVKDYFSCSRIARTCAGACVIKHSLIYGPILFQFAVNILQITTSSMGYIPFMFTHRAHAYKLHGLYTYHVHAPRAHAQARVCERARD